MASVKCDHRGKKGACKINRGVGWRNEWCKVIYLGETCECKEKS